MGPARPNFGDRPLPRIVDEDLSPNNSSRDDGAESLGGGYNNNGTLSNNDDSYFRDNQNDYDNDTIGYC